MKWRKWLENWDMTSLKIKAPFLDMEWNPSEPDKTAAWQLYVELLTRITTQELPVCHGDEKVALDSVYSLFPTTRAIVKENGRGCIEFTKIAVVILNQKIRPFTAKWHRKSLGGELEVESDGVVYEQGGLDASGHHVVLQCGVLGRTYPQRRRDGQGESRASGVAAQGGRR